MVQFLQRSPSFGQQISQDVGQSLGKMNDFYQQMAIEKFKKDQRRQLVQDIEQGNLGGANQLTEGVESEVPSDIGSQLKGKNKSQNAMRKAQAYAAADEPTLARQAMQEAKLEFSKEKYAEEKIEKSFEKHKDFIEKTSKSYQTYEMEMKPKLLQMQHMNEEELIGPASAKFLDLMGIPFGILENPTNELYDKVSQDLLKGLPETYGNKILLAEVNNFLKTIPRLTNSANGRRMIASNMLKLGEMKELMYKEMRRQQNNAIENGRKLPLDFSQSVFDNIQPQLNKLNSEFIKLSNIKDVPEGTVPFFNPQGEVSFVPKDPASLEWALSNGGKRIW